MCLRFFPPGISSTAIIRMPGLHVAEFVVDGRTEHFIAGDNPM